MGMKLAGLLPGNNEVNGLADIATSVTENTETMITAVVVLSVAKVTTDVDTGEVTPTLRIKRIEPVSDGEDKTRLGTIASRAYERRTGKTVLPLELEDELREAFSSGDDADTSG